MPESSLIISHCEIFKCLFYHKVLSSTEISAFTGKSIPYTTKVLNELIQAGFIEEKGLANSSGGRKPVNYSLVAETYYMVSVAMDQYTVQMVIIDFQGQFVTEVANFDFRLYDASPMDLAELIAGYLSDARFKPAAMVITMPGFVDTDLGVNYSFLKASKDQTLVGYLQEQFELPVFIDNNSTAIALGEYKFGVASHEKNVMVLNLGWGIGLGMIVDSKIFRGNNGLAGEFSHIPLFNNGQLCSCGKRGCLETEASLQAITRNAQEGINKGEVTSLENFDILDADVILSEAAKGDLFAVRLISEAAYQVGRGLSILIHLMNPAAVVLSGKGSEVGKIWMAPIQQAINEHCIPKLTEYTDFYISDMQATAQLIGGAALLVENFGLPLQEKLTRLNDLSISK